MKTRHVLAIGILTAIAVGLLAIGIKITGQKPKVQTNAYYYVDSYNYSNETFVIKGSININESTINPDEGRYTTSGGTYEIRNTINYTHVILNIDYFTNAEYEEWELTNPLELHYYFNTNAPSRIQITQSKIRQNTNTSWFLWYIVRINNLEPQEEYTTYNNPEYTLYETEETIVLEEANFSQTIATIKYQYQTGYTTGYQTKGDLSDGNFLSIQETMLNVLTMPFTFISQGFNVTLWEGTQYQINIGNFIKSLIAIATILFIIKMFTSGFSVIGNYTSGTGANISQWRKNRSERKLNESKARLNDRTNPNHKTRDSHVTIKKE